MLSFAFLAATASAASTADRTVSVSHNFLSDKRKFVSIMLYFSLKVAKNLSPNYYKDSETPQYITTNYGIVRNCPAPKFECKFMDTFCPNRSSRSGPTRPA